MRTAVRLALFVVLAITACHQTPRMEEEEGPAIDPFFGMPLEPGPWPTPGDGPLPVFSDADAVELRFRFLGKDDLLTAPVLTVRSGERAEIRIVNQTSYVSDFDVEVKQDAFIADPVVSIVEDGLSLRIVPVPAEEGRSVALTWRLAHDRLERPIRARDVGIGGTEPVVIQFPAVRGREAAGRTLLDAGVETALVRLAGEEPLTVFVSAAPVKFLAEADPGEEFELIPGAGVRGDESEPDSLLDGARDREPPPRGHRLAVAIGVTDGPAPRRPLHLDDVAGTLFLSTIEVLRQASVAAAAEPGAGVSWLRRTAYHRDSRPHESGVLDSEVDTAAIGFEGLFAERDGEAVLEFRYAALSEIRDVSRKRSGAEFPVERPVATERRGVLRLRGAVDVQPIGKLEDGRTMVLVVRRVIPR